MRRDVQFLRWLYGLLLNLFPGKYREEYGEEVQAVFNLSLDDAARKGGLEFIKAASRELFSLPKAIVIEYLREWRRTKMMRRFDSYFNFPLGSWKEFLTALLPFFLACAVMPLFSYLGRLGLISASSAVGNGILFALLGLFAILFIVGVGKGMPRWALPYFGFLLSLLSVYIFTVLLGGPIYMLFPNLYDRSPLFGDIFWNGVFWFGLLIVMTLLIVLTGISPLFQRFRNDWTLLCFILYGAVPFALFLTFDEYVGDEPYTLLAFLVLAVGTWFYLRGDREWNRFWILFGALALAMFIAAAGKAVLVPTQDWPVDITPALARSEAKHTIFMWLWLALIMCLPAAIKLFPRLENHPTAV